MAAMNTNNTKKPASFDKKAELQKRLEKRPTNDKNHPNCWLAYKYEFEIVTKMEREHKKQEKEKNMRVTNLRKELQLACRDASYGLIEDTPDGRERMRQLATFHMQEAQKWFSKLNKEQLAQLDEEEKEWASKLQIPKYPYGFKKGDILRYEKNQIEHAARDLVNNMKNDDKSLYKEKIEKLENLFVDEESAEEKE